MYKCTGGGAYWTGRAVGGQLPAHFLPPMRKPCSLPYHFFLLQEVTILVDNHAENGHFWLYCASNGSSGHRVDRGCTIIAIVPRDACKRCHSRKKLIHAAQNHGPLDSYIDSTMCPKKHVTTFSAITLTISVHYNNFWHSY